MCSDERLGKRRALWPWCRLAAASRSLLYGHTEPRPVFNNSEARSRKQRMCSLSRICSVDCLCSFRRIRQMCRQYWSIVPGIFKWKKRPCIAFAALVLCPEHTQPRTQIHTTLRYTDTTHTQTQAHILVDFVGILSLEGTPKRVMLQQLLFLVTLLYRWSVFMRGVALPGLDRNVYRRELGFWAVSSTHCSRAAATCPQVFRRYKCVSRDGHWS